MTNKAKILVLDRLADQGLAHLQADPTIDIEVKLDSFLLQPTCQKTHPERMRR